MKTKNGILIYRCLIVIVLVIFTNSCENDDDKSNSNILTVTDKDGNIYNTVTIGTQVWMAENLKTTKYNDGTEIPLVTDNKAWDDLTTSGYCWYENNQVTYGNYGALYNWYTVNTGKLCPTGWHVPTDAEWTTLENYLIANGYNYNDTTSGNFIAKSLAAAKNWNSSTRTGCVGNTDYPDKRNVTGFTALPSGYREYDGTFYAYGNFGSWWSSDAHSPDLAWERSIGNDFNNVFKTGSFKDNGASVRCLKD